MMLTETLDAHGLTNLLTTVAWLAGGLAALSAQRLANAVTGGLMMVLAMGGGWPFVMVLSVDGDPNAATLRLLDVWSSDGVRLVGACLTLIIGGMVLGTASRRRRRC